MCDTMLWAVVIASLAFRGTGAAPVVTPVPAPKQLSIHSPMVRKISEHVVATLSRRAHATVPAFNVKLEANLKAEGAPREASVVERSFTRLDGGAVVPEDIRALEHGYEFFVSTLAAFRPRSTLLSELNPWPHWELALTRVWIERGESTLHVTALVEPPRQKLAAEGAAAERVARFALALARAQPPYEPRECASPRASPSVARQTAPPRSPQLSIGPRLRAERGRAACTVQQPRAASRALTSSATARAGAGAGAVRRVR